MRFPTYATRISCKFLKLNYFCAIQTQFFKASVSSFIDFQFPPATTMTTTTSDANFHPIPRQVSLEPAPGHDGLRFWQFMLAGSLAGSVEHMAMFPVDTLKTRMQAALGPSTARSPATVRHSLSSLLRAEGPAGLYRGIWAMGLGAGPAHAVYFSVYELAKKLLLTDGIAGNNPALAHAAAGVGATVASDAVITPMDVVKQRLQLKGSPYKGVADCVRRVAMEEGAPAFYASYRTTVLMNAPFTAVHFAAYEAAKRGLLEGEDEDRLAVHATAGAAAGALAAAVTTPLDVVKTRLQCQGVCGCDRYTSSSIGDVAEAIVKKDGYRGLTKGWIPRMLFHAPAAAICWSTYEAAKSFFQRLNSTGSS